MQVNDMHLAIYESLTKSLIEGGEFQKPKDNEGKYIQTYYWWK